MQKRGYHNFSFKIFLLRVPMNFVGDDFSVSENFKLRKNLWIREEGFIFFLRFLSHSTEKICWRTLRCFRKFRALQKYMHKKGISLNSLEMSMSHADKNHRKLFWVSKDFRYRKVSSEKGGELHGFVEDFLISKDRKKIAMEPFCVSEIIWWGKRFYGKDGGFHDFPSTILSHCSEIFPWRTLWCFRKILPSKTFMHWRGAGHHGFVEIFCLTGPNRKSF